MIAPMSLKYVTLSSEMFTEALLHLCLLQYIFYTDHMEKIKLDHVTQVIGYHPKYLEHFLRTQNFIMYGDGPLPYNYRLYLAIMVSIY